MKNDDIADLRAKLAEQAELTKMLGILAVAALGELERLAIETGRASPIERILGTLDDANPLLGVTGPDSLSQKEALREGVIQLLRAAKSATAR